MTTGLPGLLATIDGAAWALFYFGVFGAGTVFGMMLLTAVSLAFGLFLADRFGVVRGIFTQRPHWTPG